MPAAPRRKTTPSTWNVAIAEGEEEGGRTLRWRTRYARQGEYTEFISDLSESPSVSSSDDEMIRMAKASSLSKRFAGSRERLDPTGLKRGGAASPTASVSSPAPTSASSTPAPGFILTEKWKGKQKIEAPKSVLVEGRVDHFFHSFMAPTQQTATPSEQPSLLSPPPRSCKTHGHSVQGSSITRVFFPLKENREQRCLQDSGGPDKRSSCPPEETQVHYTTQVFRHLAAQRNPPCLQV